jgi:biotin operon repressor
VASVPTWKPVPNDGAGGGSRVDAVVDAPADVEKADALLTWMMEFTHKERGRTVEELATRVDVSARKVRTLISQLRRRGYPICGTPESGYFYPATRAEAEDTLAFLNARLRSTQEMRDGVREGLDMQFGPADENLEQMELQL